MFLLLIVCMVAGTSTYYINHISNRGPVLASGLTALLAGLLLPATYEGGYNLALAATCVSYAAMAAKTRISNLREMTLCSLLVAILFSLSTRSLIGVGGRLGTIAAIAVVMVWGLKTYRLDWMKVPRERHVERSQILRNSLAFLLFISTGFLLLFQSWQGTASGLARGLLSVSLAAYVYGLYLHLKDFFVREIFEDSPDNWKQNLWLLPCAVSGAVLTYYLSATLELGPVIASGIIGVLAAVFLEGPYSVLTYTAVFAGMSSPALLPSYYHVLFAGVVVWGIYLLSRRIYQGFGSRLGTMAAGAVLLVQFVSRVIGVTF